MKLTTTITIAAAMAAVTSVSAEAKTSAGRPVMAYYCDNTGVDIRFATPAKAMASQMFSNIGVSLLWRPCNPSRPEAGAIVVELVSGTPDTFMPGALAYALPYEGVHIRILWDRIQGYPNPRVVLAHVMVHEITHILQGTARHSADGIMKAHWTPSDFSAMKTQPLSFTEDDVDLIFMGMDTRQARAAANSTVPGAQTTTAAVGIAAK